MSNLAGYEQDCFQTCVPEYLWVSYELQWQQRGRWKKLTPTCSYISAFSMLFTLWYLKYTDMSEAEVANIMITGLAQYSQPPS